MSNLDTKELIRIFEEEINNCSNAFVIGHHHADFDSIGACIGLSFLSSNYDKDCYIIIDEDDSKFEPGVKKIIDNTRNDYNYIKLRDYKELVDKDSILFVVDTSKENMISINNPNNIFKSVIIIDHHEEDDNTLDTNNKIINKESSSTCEMIASVIHNLKLKISRELAIILLAGINLDTKRFKHHTTSRTHNVARWLIDRGADIDLVNELFLEEFDSFCRISNLIINGTIIKKYSKDKLSSIQVSFTYNRNDTEEIYAKEDYAKAADQMMRFNGIDASFVLGYIEEGLIHVSARSNKKINVCKIMQKFGGGGNHQMAGAAIKSNDILALEKALMNSISYGISEELVEEPQTIKIQQI